MKSSLAALNEFLVIGLLQVQFKHLETGLRALQGVATFMCQTGDHLADGREPLMVMFTDPASGGRVAFTTFHNEAQATADVQQILTALLFQL